MYSVVVVVVVGAQRRAIESDNHVLSMVHPIHTSLQGTQNKLNPAISSYCSGIRFEMWLRRLELGPTDWAEYYVYRTPCTFLCSGDNCLISTLPPSRPLSTVPAKM